MNLIPSIGSKGIYILNAPFNQDLNDTLSYTCMAVRRLQELIALGQDPEALFYTPKAISSAIYENDLKNNVCIVSLKSDSGHWVYVPNTYIESFPDISGIPYSSIALLVHLHALPDNLDLNYLKNNVKDLVKALLGIQPDVETLAVSAQTLISQDDHALIEQNRLNNITKSQTDYAEINILRNQNLRLQTRLTELENYIRDTME